MGEVDFDTVAAFHGHRCPGLAMGYRVAKAAATRLGIRRAVDEDVVAVVENDSCAVDGIQVVTGCTAGKGNLVIRDYGKQVYTFFDRKTGNGLRIAVRFQPPAEDDDARSAWQRYLDGDRSPQVTDAVAALKARKMEAILTAGDDELFSFSAPQEPVPERARVEPSRTCSRCGEKVKASCVVQKDGADLCPPCARAVDPQ